MNTENEGTGGTRAEPRFAFRVDRALKERVTALRTERWPKLNESDVLRELVERAVPLIESGHLQMFNSNPAPVRRDRPVKKPPDGAETDQRANPARSSTGTARK